MDVNVVIANEIEIPGAALLELMEHLARTGNIVEILLSSNVFIVKKGTNTRVTLLPDCGCDSCTEAMEKIKELIKSGKTNQEITEILETLNDRLCKGDGHGSR